MPLGLDRLRLGTDVNYSPTRLLAGPFTLLPLQLLAVGCCWGLAGPCQEARNTVVSGRCSRYAAGAGACRWGGRATLRRKVVGLLLVAVLLLRHRLCCGIRAAWHSSL